MALLRDWGLDTQLIGRRILHFDELESTNTYATGLADDGVVVRAEVQTAGRGRQGRSWQSPPGSSVLMSVLLFPPARLCRPVLLTALAAVAVCEAIYECARLHATIKWPNDVLIRGKKVCGVLVEQGRGTVIGIGLNVHTPAEAFAEAGLPDAGSLEMFTDQSVDREALFESLLRQLDGYYQDLLQGLDGDLESRWRWHSGLLGKEAVVQTKENALSGRIMELAFSAIIVEDDEGPLHQLRPESIEHITPRTGGESP